MPQTPAPHNATSSRSRHQANAISTAHAQSNRGRQPGSALAPSGVHTPGTRHPAAEHRRGTQVRSDTSGSVASGPAAMQGSFSARQRQGSAPSLSLTSQRSAAVHAPQLIRGPAPAVEPMPTHPVLVRSPSQVKQLHLGHSQSQLLLGRDHSPPGARIPMSARSIHNSVCTLVGPPPPVPVQQQRDPSPSNSFVQVSLEQAAGRERSPLPCQSRAGAKYFDLTEWDMSVPARNNDAEVASPPWPVCSRSPSPTSHSLSNCMAQVPALDASSKLDASSDALQLSASQSQLSTTKQILTSHLQLTAPDIENFPSLSALRQHIDEQLRQQREFMSALVSQWEQRFLQVEQGLKAVNEGLQTSTSMAATMNERSAKFLRLGEVLEKLVAERQEAQILAQTVRTLEDDVAKIGQELAIEKEERLKLVEDVCCQAEGQVAAINRLVEAEKKRMCNEDDSLHTIASSVAGSLSGDGADVLLQLSRETAEMREQLDATSDHLMRLSKEVGVVQQEDLMCLSQQVGVVQQEVRQGMCSSSGSGGLHSEGSPLNLKASPTPPANVFKQRTSDKHRMAIANGTTSWPANHTSQSSLQIKSNTVG